MGDPMAPAELPHHDKVARRSGECTHRRSEWADRVEAPPSKGRGPHLPNYPFLSARLKGIPRT